MKELIKLSKALSNLGLSHYSDSILKLSNHSNHFLSQQHLDDLAKIAQEVYDEWEQNEEGWSDSHGEIGYGGICHIIADRLVSYLHSAGLGSSYNFCSATDTYVQHVYVMAWVKDDEDGTYNIYEIDIPYSIYETGSMFNWRKTEGVRFTGSDVVVQKIQSGVKKEDLKTYIPDYDDFDED